jgi:hypothetical protein
MPARASEAYPLRRFPFLTALLLSAALVGCALWCRLRANLHSENFQIARALVAGKGFAQPFGEPTGPTAWSAPVYPAIQAALLWAGDGSRDVVITGIVFLQVGVLVATGLLVVALAWQTTRRLGAPVAAALFALGLGYHFWHWFQLAHDCWLTLLVLNLLIAGLCWLGPLDRWPRAAGWGLFGGFCALTNPVIGFAWGVLSLALGLQQRAWSRLAVALLAAGLTLAPWTVRNYLAFGRLIPVKSNMAYEAYQSQCLQSDGLYQVATAERHPSNTSSREGREYRAIGETAYLDRKWQQLRDAIWANPGDFVERVTDRVLGVTIWYVPFHRTQEARQPWLLWVRRWTHPLPFLALLILLFTAARQPLLWPQWIVIGVYLLYLLPYIGLSYYERYTVPLVGVKVLLVLWAVDRLLSLWSQDRGDAGGQGLAPSPNRV